MTVVAPILLLLLLAAPAGVVMVAVGLRGRRVDDHPLCRRCRFDLTGLPASSGRCPECGGDVSTGTGVRVGHRRRRRGLIAAGLAALVPAVLVGGSIAWWVATEFDPTPYEPAWLLMRQADDPPSAGSDAALAELDRRASSGDLSADGAAALLALSIERLTDAAAPAAPKWDRRWGDRVTAARDAGRLSAGQVDAVTDRGLAVQADGTLAWDAAWGEWVESSRAIGGARAVSDERWRRYAKRAGEGLSLEVRPQVAGGADVLPARVAHPKARVGRNSPLKLRTLEPVVRIDGADWHDPPGASSSTSGLGPGSSGSYGHHLPLAPFRALLAPGPHRAVARVDLEVRDGFGKDASVLDGWTEELTADFRVLPDGELDAVPTVDPAIEAAVLASIRVESLSMQRGDPDRVNLTFGFAAPPIDLAFDVVLVDGEGREWAVTTISCVAGKNHTAGTGGRAEGLAAGGTVDVVLRPSRSAAERSVDVRTYWGQPVVLRGVRVHSDESAVSATRPDPARAAALDGPADETPGATADETPDAGPP